MANTPEEKEPCPNCGRTDYRWCGESRSETRCDYCLPLRMDGYYIGFGATGDQSIDRILSAIAHAGKGYHHTDGWTEDTEDWGPFHGGSYNAWIQNAANEAAAERLASSTREQALQAEVDRLKAVCREPVLDGEALLAQAKLDGLREGWKSASLPQWMGESFETFLASRPKTEVEPT